MPRQRGGQLPFVDLPYDARRAEHWADAARVADYVAHAAAHAPAGASRVLDVGPGDGWPALPIAAARPDLAVVGVTRRRGARASAPPTPRASACRTPRS